MKDQNKKRRGCVSSKRYLYQDEQHASNDVSKLDNDA